MLKLAGATNKEPSYLMIADNDRELQGVDLRPEYIHYRDTGCEFALLCLTCPFPQCIYDEPPRSIRGIRNKPRNKEIFTLFTDGSKSEKELTSMFNMSQRQVQRIIKSQKKSEVNN